MYSFRHDDILNGTWELAIARKNGNQYFLVLSKPSGFIERRELSHLNVSTSPSPNSPLLSTSGRPLIWFDPDVTRRPQASPLGTLDALKHIQPRAVLNETGRNEHMAPQEGSDVPGGAKLVPEVELLLPEHDLCHSCEYCGDLEINDTGNDAFECTGGQGYSSRYSCSKV
ncbi:hypothetical protein DL93DRAFT_1186712 [Clavulina sp. PMI_390]|nr:hypothetical protein DL93DRAFT_1186712 [Clavulina sp. PMI_390]